jgi:hypothetical protein
MFPYADRAQDLGMPCAGNQKKQKHARHASGPHFQQAGMRHTVHNAPLPGTRHVQFCTNHTRIQGLEYGILWAVPLLSAYGILTGILGIRYPGDDGSIRTTVQLLYFGGINLFVNSSIRAPECVVLVNLPAGDNGVLGYQAESAMPPPPLPSPLQRSPTRASLTAPWNPAGGSSVLPVPSTELPRSTVSAGYWWWNSCCRKATKPLCCWPAWLMKTWHSVPVG